MATRKEYQKKVERHIKDLAKRGIDPSIVTEGRTIKSLGWSQKSYNAFMERKRIAIRKEQKKQKLQQIKVHTNTQGYEFNKYDFNRIKDLQTKFNKSLQSQYKKFIQKNGKVDELTQAFLKGKPVRHKNSGENIQLQENFGNVNLIDRINKHVNIDEFIRLTEKKIVLHDFENMLDDYADFFEREFLNPLVEGLDLHLKEKEKLMELYKNMSIIERYQFNKDMKRVMVVVESDTKNPKSMYTPYLLIREFMTKQYSREFLEVG